MKLPIEKEIKDNEKDDKKLIETNGKYTIGLISYSMALKEIAKSTAPFALSSFALSAYAVGNSFIFKELGTTEEAAGALIASYAFAVFSLVEGSLLPTSIFISNLNGERKLEPTKVKEIGDVIRQSFLVGGMLSIPTAALFLSAENILKLVGIDAAIAEAVQGYFTGATYGIIPILWNYSDQQVALGLGKTKALIASIVGFYAMAMLFGYPLALGVWGLPKCKTKGIGYGASLSGLFSLIFLRIYYALDSESKLFELYNFHLKGMLKKTWNFLKIGVPMGIQNLTEWGNLLGFSILLGKLGSHVLSADQISMMPISAYTPILLAFSQAIGVCAASALGEGKAAYERKDILAANFARRNAKKLGYVGLGIGIGSSLIAATIFTLTRREITSLLIDVDNPDSNDILVMAQSFLIINSIGLVLDTVRNIVGYGIFRGYEYVLYSLLLSFTTMSVLGLTAGGLLSLEFDLGPEWIFITRDIGILLAAIGVALKMIRLNPHWFTEEPVKISKENVEAINDIRTSTPNVELILGNTGESQSPEKDHPKENEIEKNNRQQPSLKNYKMRLFDWCPVFRGRGEGENLLKSPSLT